MKTKIERILFARAHPEMTVIELAARWGITHQAVTKQFRNAGYKHPDHRTKRFKRTREELIQSRTN